MKRRHRKHKRLLVETICLSAALIILGSVADIYFVDWLQHAYRVTVTFPTLIGPIRQEKPRRTELPTPPAPSPIPGEHIPSLGKSQTTVTTGIISVVSSSSPVFAYAHGTVVADNKFFIGMANRNGNVFNANRLVIFPDPADLSRYQLLTLPRAGEVDTMIYDDVNDAVYVAISGFGRLELDRLDPHSLALSTIISTTTIDFGRRPAIVTDGTYIYGITETDPASVFKVKIATGELTVNSVGHIRGGHSAALVRNHQYTELFFGGGMSDGFEKVDADTLRSVGKLDFRPCLISDDMPYVEMSATGGYVFIGCESVPFGYRVRTSDMAVTQFPLPGNSLGMFIYGTNLYNTAQDGFLDVFPGMDIGHLKRYVVDHGLPAEATHGQKLQLNELLYSTTTERMYFTAWWGVKGIYELGPVEEER